MTVLIIAFLGHAAKSKEVAGLTVQNLEIMSINGTKKVEKLASAFPSTIVAFCLRANMAIDHLTSAPTSSIAAMSDTRRLLRHTSL